MGRFLAAGYGGLAGFDAVVAAYSLSDYVTEKSARLQAHLLRTPSSELTNKFMETTIGTVDYIVGNYVYVTVGFGIGAGIFAGLALYEAVKARKEESGKDKSLF